MSVLLTVFLVLPQLGQDASLVKQLSTQLDQLIQQQDWGGAYEVCKALEEIQYKVTGAESWETRNARWVAAGLSEILQGSDRVSEALAVYGTLSGEDFTTQDAKSRHALMTSVRERLNEALGETHFLSVLQSLRLSEWEQRDVGAVGKAYDRIFQLEKKLIGFLGKNDTLVAVAQNQLGVLSLTLSYSEKEGSRLSDASNHFAQACDKWEASGEVSPQFVYSVLSLAQALARDGKNSDAQDAYERAEEYCEAHRTDSAVMNVEVTVYNNYMEFLRSVGELSLARSKGETAVKKSLGKFGRKSRQHIIGLINFSSVLIGTRELPEAQRNAEEAVLLAEEMGHEDLLAASLAVAGTCHDIQHHVQHSGNYFRRCLNLRIRINAPNDFRLGTAYSNYGYWHDRFGDLGTAQGYLSEANEIYSTRNASLDKAFVKLRTGQVATSLDQLGLAEQLLNEAKAVAQQLPNDAEFTAQWHNAMGLLYREKRVFDKAEEYFLTAGNETENEPTLLLNLADAQLAQNKVDAATETLEKSDKVINDVASRLNARRLATYAVLHWRKKDLDTALRFAQRAVDSFQEALAAEAVGLSEQQQHRFMSLGQYLLDLYLSLAMTKKADPTDVFERVSRWKGCVLVIQKSLRRNLRGVSEKDIGKLAQVTSKWCHWNTLASVSSKAREREQTFRAEKEELQTRLGLTRLSETVSQELSSPDAETVMKALPATTALVDYFRFNRIEFGPRQVKKTPTLLAYLFSSKNMELFWLDGCERLASQINAWRSLTIKENPTSAEQSKAYQISASIRKQIWSTIELRLEDDTRYVLVCPDAELHRFPMAALPGKQQGSYLIQWFGFCRLPGARALPDIVARREKRIDLSNLLAVGEINYGKVNPDRALSQFPPLRVRPVEIDGLRLKAMQTPNSRLIYLDKAIATESEIKKLAPSATVIHISSHGFYAPSLNARGKSNSFLSVGMPELSPNGANCGIALANANDATRNDGEDGKLFAAEVALLELDNVSLVVLSACNGNNGDLASSGQGQFTIQRCLHAAGAHASVAALWDVSEIETNQLMSQLYSNLLSEKEPLSKIDALWDAQLTLLGKSRKGLGRTGFTAPNTKGVKKIQAIRGPFYWAGFSLAGDWR